MPVELLSIGCQIFKDVKIWLGFVTIFPKMVEAFTEFGITGQAVKRNEITVKVFNPRDFTTDRHSTVDDRPYGGGPGMVFKPEPLKKAVLAAKACAPGKVITVLTSPSGQPFDNELALKSARALDNEHAQQGGELGGYVGLLFVCGRYEGIDQRFVDGYVDEEWSIGDYVLTGGEMPAMMMADAVVRLLPGVLGDDQSAVQDSFMGGLLDCPHYTRPATFEDNEVPSVLLSGDHGRIADWRLKQAVGLTWQNRKDLLSKRGLSEKEKALLEEFMKELQG